MAQALTRAPPICVEGGGGRRGGGGGGWVDSESQN